MAFPPADAIESFTFDSKAIAARSLLPGLRQSVDKAGALG
jgi:hypothetical protein